MGKVGQKRAIFTRIRHQFVQFGPVLWLPPANQPLYPFQIQFGWSRFPTQLQKLFLICIYLFSHGIFNPGPGQGPAIYCQNGELDIIAIGYGVANLR